MSSDDKIRKKPLTPKLSGCFKWTNQGEDIITFDTDPNVWKAIMPCGHRISSESMKDYFSNELKSGKSTIKCPAFDCNEIWSFSACKTVIMSATIITTRQMEDMEKQISINYISGLRRVEPCPVCHYLLEKSQYIGTDKVSCPKCAKDGLAYFCWSCKKTWISDSDQKCGNAACDRGASKLEILATCPDKVIGNRSAPSVRGCPNCGLLVNHIDKCNRVNCPSCRKYFCFFCLNVGNSESDLCGQLSRSSIQEPSLTPAPSLLALRMFMSSRSSMRSPRSMPEHRIMAKTRCVTAPRQKTLPNL